MNKPGNETLWQRENWPLHDYLLMAGIIISLVIIGIAGLVLAVCMLVAKPFARVAA